MSLRPLVLALSVFVAAASVPAQYLADTGRTEKLPAVQWSKAGSNPADAPATATATAGTPGTGGPAEAVTEIQAAEFFLPAVERAVVESGLARVAVQSEGVQKTLNTFAEIMVHAVTGKTRYAGQDPLYTALSMIYQTRQWMRVPMIPVESPQLAELFGLDPRQHHRVSPLWVMKNPQSRDLVMALMNGRDAKEVIREPAGQKALKKFAFRLAAFYGMSEDFKLLPLPNSEGAWVSPTLLEHPELAQDPRIAPALADLKTDRDPAAGVMALHGALGRAFGQGKPDDLAPAVSSLLLTLGNDPLYMPDPVRKLDYWNTNLHPFQKSAWAYLLATLAFGAFLWTARRPGGSPGVTAAPGNDGFSSDERPAPSIGLARELAPAGGPPLDALEPAAAPPAVGVIIRRPASAGELPAEFSGTRDMAPSGSRALWGFSFAMMTVATLILIAALVIRFILGQRMPVSNLYESITFSMGAFGVVSLVFEAIYRRGWVGAGACLFGWGLMTMANSMPLHMRKVEPLVAVLNSFWLNYHVTSLLISYSAFLLSFVFCLLYFVKHLAGNRPGVLPQKEVFEYLNYRAVQVGWPLLTLGIFLGAVWANTAWGSAWSWDPKETWALITWLTYTVFLHLRMNLGWTGHRAVTASIIGFAMVLVTYFGVSYLPGLAGGLHSYAEPIAR